MADGRDCGIHKTACAWQVCRIERGGAGLVRRNGGTVVVGWKRKECLGYFTSADLPLPPTQLRGQIDGFIPQRSM